MTHVTRLTIPHRSPTTRTAFALAAVTLAGAAATTLPPPARADMPLDPAPAWTSTPLGHVATGGTWADVDGDGWLDMVVANGNDMAMQPLVIYYNQGDGTLPLVPSWTASDSDYHGHLDVGDLDGDGLLDVAVAVYIGHAGFSEPGKVKVYLNDGAGGFHATPDWQSGVRFYCFSVALGDADGDGDLDLACTAGESYNSHPERQKIFFNQGGGGFESTPSWESDEIGYALDAFWDDVDHDGDLDLAYCGAGTPMRVYLNGQVGGGGGLATSASWESGDASQEGNTSAFGDWDGDGFPELAVADNYQLGGSGRFKLYGNAAGALTGTPVWTSATGGYGSHVSWVDLDADGDLDLGAGRWWGAARLYENTGGGLTATPVWTSATSSVIENMFWGDVDNDGLRGDGLASATGDGARTYFKLGQAPVRSVEAVRVNGTPLAPGTDYAVHRAHGWVSLAAPPPAGAPVEIEFTYSLDLDLGVTNWDSSKGNYLFRNTATVGVPDLAQAVRLLRAAPNPVAHTTTIRYRGTAAGDARLAIYDVGGRLVRRLHDGPLAGGLRTWEWDARGADGRRVARGVYFARLVAGTHAQVLKLAVL